MAGREVVGGADPYRVLQVDPAASLPVITAAFTVLREMVLTDDSEGAPLRLAELNAAYRTLSDSVRRAAHDAAGWHIAHVDIALPHESVDPALLADVVAAFAPVHAIADASPGFVWRLATDEGGSTEVETFGDGRIIVSMSVWESVEALRAFTDREEHVAVLRRREWFTRLSPPETVLWWVPVGTHPTVANAEERLTALRADGPAPRAFTLRSTFPPTA